MEVLHQRRVPVPWPRPAVQHVGVYLQTVVVNDYNRDGRIGRRQPCSKTGAGIVNECLASPEERRLGQHEDRRRMTRLQPAAREEDGVASERIRRRT
jgi:hypothetical protein